MRRVVFSMLLVANAILAGALWAAPPDGRIQARGFRNCCEASGPGEEFCCFGCCWFIADCQINSDCM